MDFSTPTVLVSYDHPTRRKPYRIRLRAPSVCFPDIPKLYLHFCSNLDHAARLM